MWVAIAKRVSRVGSAAEKYGNMSGRCVGKCGPNIGNAGGRGLGFLIRSVAIGARSICSRCFEGSVKLISRISYLNES